MRTFTLGEGALEVSEAEPAELDRFAGAVRGEARATLSDWTLVAVRRPHQGTLRLVAVGVSSRTSEWLTTSPVLALHDLRRIRTLSGHVYELGVRRLFGEHPLLEEHVRLGLRRLGHP